MLIFTNIRTENNSRIKIYAYDQISKIIQETIEDHSYLDEDYNCKAIKITKKTEPYKNYDSLIILSVTAKDVKDKIVAEKRVILKNHEN